MIGNQRPLLVDQPHGFDAVHPRHEDIEEQQVERRRPRTAPARCGHRWRRPRCDRPVRAAAGWSRGPHRHRPRSEFWPCRLSQMSDFQRQQIFADTFAAQRPQCPVVKRLPGSRKHFLRRSRLQLAVGKRVPELLICALQGPIGRVAPIHRVRVAFCSAAQCGSRPSGTGSVHHRRRDEQPCARFHAPGSKAELAPGGRPVR